MNGSRDPRLIRSLQYFESVSRHGSLQSAASELGVTPSAVSHQLRELSKSVGEDLFVRSGRGIALTEAGHSLAKKLSQAFTLLDHSMEEIVGEERKRVRVAVCSAFGPYWLVPKLPDFLSSNPGIDLELRLYAEEPEQTQSVADCIVTARPVKLGFAASDLFAENLIAVVSTDSALQASNTPLITTDIGGADLAKDWKAFFAEESVDGMSLRTSKLVTCTHYLLAIKLARAGVGAAIVPDFLAANDIRSGSLRQVSPRKIRSGRTYRLCVKEARQHEHEIGRFSKWLRGLAKVALVNA